MRAIIYTRVSSDSSGRGRSVEEQERECRAVCDSRGWNVARVFCDNDIGASRHSGKSRPAWEELRETLTAGDILVTWEASRAQRDLAAYVELRDVCAERGVQWHYGGSTYDLSTGEGRFRTGLDALLAENEAEKIRERVLRAHRANVAAGRPHGPILYGYKAKRCPDTGRLLERVTHPERAAVLQEAARRVLAGESAWTVARDFNARGLEAPGRSGKWVPRVLASMLKNPSYAGLRVHKGQIVGPGQWEPLLSEEDSRTLKAILTDPSRLAHRGVDPTHLLTGIATCGVEGCGRKLERRKNGGYPAYVCPPHLSRNMERVDTYVEAAIIARLEDPTLVGKIGSANSETARLYAEAQAIQARLDEWISDGIAGKVSPSAVGQAERQLLPQIAELEQRARQSVLSPLVGEMAGPQAAERWGSATITRRRDLVRALVEIRILPTGKGRRAFDPDCVQLDWIEG